TTAAFVIPAQAGIQPVDQHVWYGHWIPACGLYARSACKHLRSQRLASILVATLLNKDAHSMERELWTILSTHLTRLARRQREENFEHPTGRILRVYLWAILNDRSVDWACRRQNWRGVK